MPPFANSSSYSPPGVDSPSQLTTISSSLSSSPSHYHQLPPLPRSRSSVATTTSRVTSKSPRSRTHKRTVSSLPPPPPPPQQPSTTTRPPRRRTTEVSIQALEQQLKQAKQHNHAVIYNQLGTAHFRRGKMLQAKEYYQSAIRCHPLTPHTATAFMNLGTVYWSMGQTADAIKMLEQALASHELDLLQHKRATLDTSNTAALIYHQLGLCCSLQKRYDAALLWLQRALQVRETLQLPVDVAKTWDAMGTVYELQGYTRAAVAYYEAAYDQLQQAQQGVVSISVLVHLAAAYENTNTLKAVVLWRELAVRQPTRAKATWLHVARLLDREGLQADAADCRKQASLLDER